MKNSFYENLLEKIKSKDIKIVSVDFFDTLMSRRVQHPKNIFILLARRLIESRALSFNIGVERFQEIRVLAEQKARESGGTKEVSLDGIYRQFPSNFFNISIEQAVQAEVETEKEFLFPMMYMIQALELANRRGKKIVVTSDTYLSSAHLKFLWGSNTPEIDVTYFTSSEHSTGKSERLFDVVAKCTKTKPENILHVGDNYVSDVQTPSRKGIATCFMPHGTGSLWNTIAEEFAGNSYSGDRLPGKFGDMGIAAIRCKTALFENQNKCDSTNLTNYGAQILGPILSSFAHWIYATAKEESTDLIMPLMREGYIIEKLLSRYEDIFVRPLYLSRRILFQAELIHADKDMLEALRFKDLRSSVADYLELIGLHPEDFSDISINTGLSIGDDVVFKRLVEMILASKDILNSVKTRAMDVRRGICSHIAGLTKINGKRVRKITLADVGWNGTIQRMLQKLFNEENIDITVHGLYMMTTPAVNKLLLDGVLAKGFLLDGGYPESDHASLSRTLEIFEQSCAPSHGSVLSHDLRTGAPILKIDQIPAQQRADIEDIQEGILLYNDLYCKHTIKEISPSDLKELGVMSKQILRRAMLSPSHAEALMFSQWVHDDNLASGATMSILGEEYSRSFASYKTMQQYFGTSMNDLYWPAGALAIHDPKRAQLLALASKHQLSGVEFDFNLNLSTELAVSSANSVNDAGEFKVASTQVIYVNSHGKSYIKFDAKITNNASLRWMPASKPFFLSVDFILFRHLDENGSTVHHRISREKIKSLLSNGINIEFLNENSWHGSGGDAAFYLGNLADFGVAKSGRLSIEIACRIREIDKFTRQSTTKNISESGGISKKIGYYHIEHFNGAPMQPNQTELTSTGATIHLSGWIIDRDFEHVSQEIHLRVTNLIGETHFIPMTKQNRPDVVEHIKKPAQSECGFLLENLTLQAGVYDINVVSKSGDFYLIGEKSRTLAIN